MVEREKFVGNLAGAGQVEAIQAHAHLITQWRPQTRPEQRLSQRVDVTAAGTRPRRAASSKRRTASGKGIVDGVAGTGQPIDEKRRQLRLETGAIRDLVQAVRGTLTTGPVLIRENRYRSPPPLRVR